MPKRKALSRAQLVELINKNWMTHDAMWFVHCLNQIGIEKTSMLNCKAVRSMANIEVRRIMKVLDMQQIENFEDLKRFLFEGYELIRPKFMLFEYSFPEKNLIRWQTSSCFAFDGIKKLRVLDGYQCGIVERIIGWLEGAGIGFTIFPNQKGCLKHTNGDCYWEIKTNLS